MTHLRVGIIGAGKRVDYLYCPLVRALKDDLDLVGICSRGHDRARDLALKHGTTAFGDVPALIEQGRPDLLLPRQVE